MHAALWLPRFQLQAALRAPPAGMDCKALVALLDEPAGARHAAQVLHACEMAERQGVRAGMTATQAQARCPSLILLRRDAALESAAQQTLLQCAAQWTPHYETTLPGCAVLDLRRSRDVTGREESHGRDMLAWLSSHAMDARVGFAANADLAMLAARATSSVLVLRDARDEARFLHQLPVASLRPSADSQQVLELWGVRTLGELIRLPRADVTARLGQEGRLLWDMAAGGRQRLLKLVRPTMSFRDELELEHAIECLEPLLFLLRRLLQGLCERLADVWLVAAAMQLTLRFDDRTEHQRELHVAEPARDPGLLLRVLETHLGGLSAAAPIRYVALEIRPVTPLGNQGQLFERALRDPNRFAETLTQLEALLGTGHVGKARLLPSRRTDAFTVTAFREPSSTDSTTIVPTPTGLPLRRLRPSPRVQVKLAHGSPDRFHHDRQWHDIAKAEGPWLLSGDWWDATLRWDKEVWTVATHDGVLYQLARQNEVWLLEGTLG
jgi:protein ImuB